MGCVLLHLLARPNGPDLRSWALFHNPFRSLVAVPAEGSVEIQEAAEGAQDHVRRDVERHLGKRRRDAQGAPQPANAHGAASGRQHPAYHRCPPVQPQTSANGPLANGFLLFTNPFCPFTNPFCPFTKPFCSRGVPRQSRQRAHSPALLGHWAGHAARRCRSQVSHRVFQPDLLPGCHCQPAADGSYQGLGRAIRRHFPRQG
mmetsp:Transcript_31393/g.73446  ORF Transcript_31393/g.73446 Transcript_31393/m.73446 type:complete len:202 (-) Transcript_31393:559-1164(-)